MLDACGAGSTTSSPQPTEETTARTPSTVRREIIGPGCQGRRRVSPAPCYMTARGGPMRRPRELTALGYRRIVQLLVTLVIVPVILLTAVGVVLMFVGEAGV